MRQAITVTILIQMTIMLLGMLCGRLIWFNTAHTAEPQSLKETTYLHCTSIWKFRILPWLPPWMRPSPGRLSQAVVVGSTGWSFVERMNIYIYLCLSLLGRIQGGSQGSILNFHILVQCKYVFLLNFEALLCARVNIVLSEMFACGCY
jgi:hypothetical protein